MSDTYWPNDRQRVEVRVLLPESDLEALKPLMEEMLDRIKAHEGELFGDREWHAAAEIYDGEGVWSLPPKLRLVDEGSEHAEGTP